MSGLPETTLGRAYSSSIAYDTLEEIVDAGNRMPGHDGELRAIEVLSDRFEEVGLDQVSVESFGIPGWWRGTSRVTVDAPDGQSFEKEHEVLALPGTPEGTVEAELVDLGYGYPEEIGDEVEGKIALVRSDNPDDYGRWIHRMEKYGAAVDGGAVGFVFGNHIEGCLPPTGEVGYQNRPSNIHAVGVSREVAAELRRLAVDSTPIELSIECRHGSTTSNNVHGFLGPETDRRVLVSAHIDAHDISQGAIDNGAGSALVTEISCLLAGVADRLETRVEFVVFGAEEIGLYGSRHYVETRDLSSVKALLNLDGIGTSRTPKIRAYSTEVGSVIADVAEGLDVPSASSFRIDAATDAWPFVATGVPAVTVGSKNESSGRGWGHTHGDTLEKVDPRDLRDLSLVLANAVYEVAKADQQFDHHTPEAVREELDQGCINELYAGARWPFDEAS